MNRVEALYSKLKKHNIQSNNSVEEIIEACNIPRDSFEFLILDKSWPIDRNKYDNYHLDENNLHIPMDEECPLCKTKKGTHICPSCLEAPYNKDIHPQENRYRFGQRDQTQDRNRSYEVENILEQIKKYEDSPLDKIKDKYSNDDLFLSSNMLADLPEGVTLADVKKELRDIDRYIPTR